MSESETQTPSTSISNIQEVDVNVTFTDNLGRPVEIDGTPSWQVNDETIATIEVAEDGRSAIVRSVGAVGRTFVTVTADAELGEGTREVSASFDVEVTESAELKINFSFGTPRNR